MMNFVFVIFTTLFVTEAAVDTKALSKKVIELRQEVELLNDEYKTERQKVLNELKSLSIQKAELAANIRNEEVREKQLREKMAKLKKDIGQSSIESSELLPVIEKTIASLKKYIKNSLPFKQSDRLEAVTSLEKRLVSKEISAVKATNQVWAIIEDEKRLARETSLHKQTIPLAGKMNLAEVIKVGMVLFYFKSENGDLGMARKKEGQWKYLVFHDQEKQRQTLAFFESIKKQIRQGFFELPTKL